MRDHLSIPVPPNAIAVSIAQCLPPYRADPRRRAAARKAQERLAFSKYVLRMANTCKMKSVNRRNCRSPRWRQPVFASK